MDFVNHGFILLQTLACLSFFISRLSITLMVSVVGFCTPNVSPYFCTDTKQWKDLSYCMAQLTYTDKSLKKLIELFPKYQNALGEAEVVEHFKSIVAKVWYVSATKLV